ALVILIASGAVHGVWTDRWTVSAALAAATDKLADVPLTVGEWDAEALAMDPEQQAAAGISGYAQRRFTHRRTGQSLSVLIVCGRAGPVAVHPPEVCYTASGFELVGPRTRHSLGPEASQAPAEFFVGHFVKKTDATPLHLRIFWSWSSNGAWSAPDDSRIAFASKPVLYKLYLVRPMARGDEPVDEDPGLEFLRLLLPQLQQTLFADLSQPK